MNEQHLGTVIDNFKIVVLIVKLSFHNHVHVWKVLAWWHHFTGKGGLTNKMILSIPNSHFNKNASSIYISMQKIY
jgi:hypothetical protein